MSVQRWGIDMFAEKWKDEDGDWIDYADHARIVAEVREKALNDAKRAVRAECYHDSDEWCVFVAAIDGLIGDKR
jgi:hypothetical protein